MFRNKLLVYSFGISVALNTIFLMLVGKSNLFQHTDTVQNLRVRQIEVYKPPVLEKPKPTPKITPPRIKHKPPPHPVLQPKNRPAVPQPLQPVRPTVPQTQKPQIQHPAPQPAIFVKHQPTSPATKPAPFVPSTPHMSTPQPLAHPATNLGSHSAQGTVATPTSPAPVVQPTPMPTPGVPQPETHPAPAPNPPQPRPAAPVEELKPKPSMANRGTPEIVGSWDDLQLPDNYDPSTVTRTTISARWTVDKTGHARGIKFPSSGNSDIDAAIRSFIERHHYEPAVQNGEPQDCLFEHTFVISQ